ncbi:MAG TPA: mandelate racemase/muconate lactonizing enzyme family protein [Chloroflexia bacterium]|nr:mandelate racemase/muconate lactonizing enzyme family protein [Chloroflexia bacterium]
MRILKIYEKAAPLKDNISNAYINFSQMTTSIVAIVTDVVRDGKKVIGYGFNSNGRYAPSGLLHERFIPRIMQAPPEILLNEAGDNFDPHKIWQVMMTGEKPGGHGERSVAVGTLDMAIWDAVAKIENKPLFRLLGERYCNDQVDENVFVYAAGGYYRPGKDLQGLQEELRSYLDMGYSQVKMKIGGASLAEDLRRVEAALAVVPDGQALAVDANGRFDLPTAIEYGRALAPYKLRWYEEPGDPLDYALQAELSKVYQGPMATGENLFSMQDARNLVRYAGMRPDRDILQMDCSLSYGLVEYLRTLEMLKEHGWSPRSCIPHGGHQMALNIAAGLGLGGNESYPGIFQPFGGFADNVPVENGYVRLPEAPGVGLEEKKELMKLYKELVED